ncbi:MAG: phage holin family protein [Candidatus Promineofilum sp.]|nr:phage holin family protein [Promineifilum sp.]
MLNWILSAVIAIVVYAIVIYIVSRLGLGLTVSSFTDALIAGAVIAIVAWLVNWLLVDVFEISVGANWLGAILNLVVAAVVLMIADRFVPGMKVGGFVGALIAAIAIAVVAWLIGLLLPIETNPTQQGLLLLNALI